ncbi:hypothetical protein LTR37_019676 [Vermiconidia calcicola]|uniref:Uncharacterized protein n=1 Tax=Vermiconidia calcicola TaxID=1690605 RepID=A0ACC3MEL3_9PEZI|nr:hypothetical protein LTR37_019676 [Vermiconidia calcicola]
MQLSPATNCSVFRFLDLPGEIRNRIYHFVYANAEGQIVLWISQKSPSAARRRTHKRERTVTSSTYLALPAVCRQIRSEASPYLYSVVQVGIDTNSWSDKRTSMYFVKDLLFHSFARSLERLLRDFGPKLNYVKHVRFVGLLPFMAALSVEKDALHNISTNPLWRALEFLILRRAERADRAINAFRQHLANVTCITLATTRHTIPDITWNDDSRRHYQRLENILHNVEERKVIQHSLPNIRDVKLCGDWVSCRWWVGASGAWSYWYSGEDC